MLKSMAFPSRWAAILAIISIGIFVYRASFSSGYFQWDDQDLVVDNTLVHHLAFSNLNTFFRSTFLGNYQPLTMMAYMLEWHAGKGDPWPFHLVSILLHVCCAIVVYRLADALSKEQYVALGTALLFVASPVQVESASWISQQKTVLSGFFYFLAMLQYNRYCGNGSKLSYFLVLIFFILGILSKATAVMLPISLLGIALLTGNKGSITKRWLGLALFVFVAIGFGSIAIWAQAHDGYLRPGRLNAPLVERCVFAAFALCQYVLRMVLPFHLSALYPIPEELRWYHLAIGIGGLLFALFIFLKPGLQRRKRIGLLLLFIGPLIPLLQLIPFGEALTADRYGYVACFPVFFLISTFLFRIPSHLKVAAPISIGAVCVLISINIYAAQGRTHLWNDELAMFKNVVSRYPDSDIAQFNLANAYRRVNRLSEARDHFSMATKLNNDYPQAWLGLGVVNASLHQCDSAISDFSKVISIAPDHPNTFTAYYQRAMCYLQQGKAELGRADLLEAIHRRPDFAPAHYRLAKRMAGSGDHRNTIREYSLALAYGYDRPTDCLLNRAISLGWLGDNGAAITDLNTVIGSDPGNAAGWFLRGIAKLRQGAEGCPDLERAKALGYPEAGRAVVELCQRGGAEAGPTPPPRGR